MKIVNCVALGEMCEAALDGEPVFVLRAKDMLALDTLIDYSNRARSNKSTNQGRVATALDKFKEWRLKNPNKLKMPD